jgi:pyruvate dehydrogenase E2 component (dihydrolipoamide acetyltransferase)
MEFESFHEGTLLHIGIQEGETSPVDKLLAIIGDEGEDISGFLCGDDNSNEADSSSNEEKEEESKEVETEGASNPFIS